jgi:hypothetical protein
MPLRKALPLLCFTILAACAGNSSTPLTRAITYIGSPLREPTAQPGDWPTYGFDTSRTSYNPNETVLSSTTIAAQGLTRLWQFNAGGVVVAQPVVASGVSVAGAAHDIVYAGDNLGNFYALDAASGTVLWQKKLAALTNTGCTDLPDQVFGISGAALIDRATNRVYVADGAGKLYAFDLATGATASGWPAGGVALLLETNEHIYGGLTFDAARHAIYAGAGSLCDQVPYEGQVIAVNADSAQVTARWYPIAKPPSAYNGGGIWGPGGVSLDPRGTGYVYTFTANADTAPPGAFPDSIVRLDPSLTGAVGIDPDPTTADLGFGSTPTIVAPSDGCSSYRALGKDKNGILYDFENIDDLADATLVQRLQIADSDLDGVNVGTVAYLPSLNMIFSSNGRDSSTTGLMHGILAFALQSDCTIGTLPVWSHVNGPDAIPDDPPGNPSVANGVVYYTDGPSGNAYAYDAPTGNPLWTFALGGASYTAPSIADGRVFVAIWGSGAPGTGAGGPGGIQAFGLASAAPASAARARARRSR